MILDLTVCVGHSIEHVLPGSGGYGDPLQREPARVVADVASGKVSPAHARGAYAVVLDAEGTGVDVAATAELRARLADHAPG